MLFFSLFYLFYLALFKMSVIYLSSLLLFFFFPSSFVLPNEALSLQFFVSSPSILFLFSLLIFPSARMDNSNNSMQCRVLSRATKYQERGGRERRRKRRKKSRRNGFDSAIIEAEAIQFPGGTLAYERSYANRAVVDSTRPDSRGFSGKSAAHFPSVSRRPA